MKTAFIIGVSRQMGVYLAQRLRKQGYRVIGWTQYRLDSNSAHHSTEGIGLLRDVEIVDQKPLLDVLTEYQPDEVYYFQAPQVSVACPEFLFKNSIDNPGIVAILESIRHINPEIRFCIASSNSVIATAQQVQHRKAPTPSSQYRLLSVYDQWALSHYRNDYQQHVFSGILINPTSSYQRPELLARKITTSVARIKLKLERSIHLGNLDECYIWGHPADYASALHHTIQQEDPADYLITTGESHTVREFVETAFEYFGIDWEEYVVEDRNQFHALQVQQFTSGSANPIRKLKWDSTISFRDMIYSMIDVDFQSEIRRSTSLFSSVRSFRSATAVVH